jgi:hypothetical protein
VLVLAPHGVLGFVAFWLWWPKSKEGWRKFLLVAGYLFAFLPDMRYTFDLR